MGEEMGQLSSTISRLISLTHIQASSLFRDFILCLNLAICVDEKRGCRMTSWNHTSSLQLILPQSRMSKILPINWCSAPVGLANSCRWCSTVVANQPTLLLRRGMDLQDLSATGMIFRLISAPQMTLSPKFPKPVRTVSMEKQRSEDNYEFFVDIGFPSNQCVTRCINFLIS